MTESERPSNPGDAPEPTAQPEPPSPAPAGPDWWTPPAGPTPPPPGPAAAPTWSATSEPSPYQPPQSDVTQPQTPPEPNGPFAAWPPPPPSPQAALPPTMPPGPAAASSWPPPPPPSWPPSPPGGYGAGGWGEPAPPPGGWPQSPEHSPSQRVVAAFVAVLLVIASAGVGAAIALAVHHNSSASTTFPNFGNNNGGGFFGGGSSNGSGSDGTTTSSCSSSSFSSSDAQAVADRVDPAVVNINTTLNQGRAAGTGMVISPDGAVLTNNHVIADSTNVKVDIGGTGNVHTAHVVGYDVQDDVALLQIEGVSNLKTVNLGDPSKSKVGDCVVAIGNALGKGGKPSVASGQVTALNRRVTAGDPAGGTTETLTGMIQIDAPIQPGDSGGPLVDPNGNVIGMNTAAASGRFNVGGSNVGFAIPVTNAMTIIRQIQSGTETDRVHIGGRALLGVSVRDVSDANGSAPADSGAYVESVQNGTGASDAGIQSGDVIVSINGKSIADQNALHLALTIYHPGDKVDVGWVDANGRHRTANVQLGSGPPA